MWSYEKRLMLPINIKKKNPKLKAELEQKVRNHYDIGDKKNTKNRYSFKFVFRLDFYCDVIVFLI